MYMIESRPGCLFICFCFVIVATAETLRTWRHIRKFQYASNRRWVSYTEGNKEQNTVEVVPVPWFESSCLVPNKKRNRMSHSNTSL